MQTCLGLYIEDHVIKYAKVSTDNTNIKIDAFGIKFYDKLDKAVQQVISETYSYKTPICTNLTEEVYNYFHLFSLLNKKDIENVIKTEFESLCYDKGINKDVFETRYVLVENPEDKEKVKAIHVAANKASLAKQANQLEGNRISAIAPIGMSVANILSFDEKQNVIIVNIEEKTTVTTVVGDKVFDVQVFEEGSNEILSKINAKENSYSKAYEICKNSTIYTNEGKDLQYEENDYLDYIMPTLYNIVGNVRKIISTSLQKIDKVYITGTASVINNIDIYFQEYLNEIKCEVLKPYFINDLVTKVNVKDYIEVNSAIGLALQGLGEGIKTMNFKKKNLKDDITSLLSVDIGNGKNKKTTGLTSKIKMPKMDFNLKGELTALEMNLIRTGVGLVLLVSVYGGFTVYLNSQINNKMEEVAVTTAQINTQIENVNSDKKKVDDNISKYKSMITKLQDLNNQASETARLKNAIPNLLNQIMFAIPKQVQITSIENTTDTHIVINVQSEKYEQLGIFQAALKNQGILTNVVSDSGQKQSSTSIAKITIEGDLP